MKQKSSITELSEKEQKIILTGLHDIPKFSKFYFQWEPHPAQLKWLTAQAKQKTLATGRRWGKSEAQAIDFLHFAFYNPGSKQLNVSITQDQANIIFNTIVSFALSSPEFNKFIQDKPTYSPHPKFKLATGSEIWSRSTARNGLYIRGHKFNRVNIDEAAYIKQTVVDEVIRMTLADYDGDLLLTSTPNGKNWFFREFEKGLHPPEPPAPGPKSPVLSSEAQSYGLKANGYRLYYSQTGNSYENPHISHAFLKRLEQELTQEQLHQELKGQFIDYSDAIFNQADLDQCCTFEDPAAVKGIEGDITPFKFYIKPYHSHKYVDGWDLAKQQDWTVGITLDITQEPWLLAAFQRSQKEPWQLVYKKIRDCQKKYHSQVLIDSTGIGDAVLDEVKDIAQGFKFTPRQKTELIINLQKCIQEHRISFPFIKQLYNELRDYQWDDQALTTDCVIALALACWKAKQPQWVIDLWTP